MHYLYVLIKGTLFGGWMLLCWVMFTSGMSCFPLEFCCATGAFKHDYQDTFTLEVHCTLSSTDVDLLCFIGLF